MALDCRLRTLSAERMEWIFFFLYGFSIPFHVKEDFPLQA